MRTRLPGRARGIRAGLAAGLVAILVAMAVRFPNAPHFTLPCVFHILTGLPCLFCGGTRAMRAIMHGQWELALYLNPLAFPVFLAVLLAVLFLVIEAVRGRPLRDWEGLLCRTGRFVPVAAALCLAWWLTHIVLALKTPKSELVDLRNPIAEKARSFFERH
ncbi:MAG: DUF2752 domain-containing protein [Verrucomicrobiae bacterium]